ncbi:MAG: SIS domain-containing protein [Acidobacteriota bacterium]
MSLDRARKVLAIEARAIERLIGRIDENFERAVTLLVGCRGRVVVTGMGKSGIIGRKIAATLNSTGTPSQYLHPGEALHGDLGMVAEGDVVLAISNSGETEELLQLLEPIKRLSVPLISFLGRASSDLARASDVVLDVSVEEEACPLDLAPTASTTASLALGDALAMAVLERKGFTPEDFAVLHPRGSLSFKLRRVEDVMHIGEEIPVVNGTTLMRDVIYEMSRKGLGVTCVVDDEERLIGIISDGDLRRQLEKDDSLLAKKASDCMTRNPVTIGRHELATRALAMMEERKITSVLVPGEDDKVLGIVHLHHLWRLGKYF